MTHRARLAALPPSMNHPLSQHRWALLASAAVLAGVAWAPRAHAQNQEMGRVISSVPVIQQSAVPRQVCTNEQVVVPGQKSGAGAVMGGLAGGAIGNQIGGGGGRAVATLLGVVGGAMLGNSIEGDGAPQAQYQQRCTTQTVYENRTVGYNVTYEYAGKQYTVQMPQDPGPWVQLQVTPVASNPNATYPTYNPFSPPATGYQAPSYSPPATAYPAPNPFTQPPVYLAPQSWVEPAQPSVTYISPPVFTTTTYVPNTVYVRPYASYPTYPTYPLAASPLSTRINLSWSNNRGNDHGHRGNDRWDRADRNNRWDRDGDRGNRWR